MPLSRLLPASFEQPNPTNLIINGAAQVQQRGDLSVSAGVTNEGFAPDRFHVLLSNMGQLAGTFTTVADAPDNTGLTRSIKWTTTTPENSIDSNELYSIRHNIEAQNLQSLEYGTSDAKYTTLSFWVKSSVTGTFGITLYHADGNQTITNTYTIASANTWQYVTWTIPPNTSQAINNDNGEGLRFIWQLASGSTYDGGSSNQNNWISHVNGSWAYGHAQDGVVTTDNATFQITGVCFNVGSKSISGNDGKSFPHESYDVTLRKCKRYFLRQLYYGYVCQLQNYATTGAYGTIFPVQGMAGTPSVTTGGSDQNVLAQANSSATGGGGTGGSALTGIAVNGGMNNNSFGGVVRSGGTTVSGASGLVVGYCTVLYTSGSGSHVYFDVDAEL